MRPWRVRLFDVLWSQVWMLQLAKEMHARIPVHNWTELASIVMLGWCVAACMLPAICCPQRYERMRVRRLCWLALCGLVYLALRGSSSNHVVLQGVLSLLVLEASCMQFETASVSGARRLLGGLYLVTFVAKCNWDFFDRDTSCAMVYTVAGGATIGVEMWPEWVLRAAPTCALVGELCLGLGFWYFESANALVMMGVGAIFHIGLALPRPPLSVYPFSMLVAPLFALASGVDSVSLAPAVLIFAIAFHRVNAFQAIELYEYPPYGSWRVGVAWCTAAFAAVVMSVASSSRALTSRRARGTPLATCLIFLIGSLPYLGIRAHPCFIMFSNLRLEANSNHWFFTDTLLDAIDIGAHRATDLVVIHNASPYILQMRVDLGAYAVDSGFLQAHRLSPEFLISPPPGHFLPPQNISSQRPSLQLNFAVVLHELRRRVSATDQPLFVEYSRENAAVCRFERHANGSVSADPDNLLKLLPHFDAFLFRFRAFDLHKSPCRH